MKKSILAIVCFGFLAAGCNNADLTALQKENADLRLKLDNKQELSACLQTAENAHNILWNQYCKIEAVSKDTVLGCSLSVVRGKQLDDQLQLDKDNCFKQFK